MLILQQNRNTTPSIKRKAAQNHPKHIDTPKLTIGHFIALQREEIHLHPLEHRCKLLQTESVDTPLVQPHPQGADSTIKINHELPDCRKGTTNPAI